MRKLMTQGMMLCVLVGLCATAQAVTLSEAIDMLVFDLAKPGETVTMTAIGVSEATISLEFTHFLTSKTHLTPMDKGEGAFS